VIDDGPKAPAVPLRQCNSTRDDQGQFAERRGTIFFPLWSGQGWSYCVNNRWTCFFAPIGCSLKPKPSCWGPSHSARMQVHGTTGARSAPHRWWAEPSIIAATIIWRMREWPFWTLWLPDRD